MNKVLLINTDPAQSEALTSILSEDCTLTVCHSAEEGLERARKEEYALILLDVDMAGADDFTLLRELKSQESTRYIPVILLTGPADARYGEQGLASGATDYITEPFIPTIVRTRINTHIQLHQYQMGRREQPLVDAFTGLANRQRYECEGNARWQDAIRFEIPFSLCLIDIDRFGLYNDTFGHTEGDKTLASVARTVAAHFRRGTDLFARYDGEKFVAVFLGSQGESAFEFMKSVRQSVEDLHIPHNFSVSQWVTVSVGGITLIPQPQNSLEHSLRMADAMLSDAKKLGRNQVVWCNQGREQWQER